MAGVWLASFITSLICVTGNVSARSAFPPSSPPSVLPTLVPSYLQRIRPLPLRQLNLELDEAWAARNRGDAADRNTPAETSSSSSSSSSSNGSHQESTTEGEHLGFTAWPTEDGGLASFSYSLDLEWPEHLQSALHPRATQPSWKDLNQVLLLPCASPDLFAHRCLPECHASLPFCLLDAHTESHLLICAFHTVQVFVILFGVGTSETEGIYSLRALSGDDGLPQDTIIAFECEDDAVR